MNRDEKKSDFEKNQPDRPSTESLSMDRSMEQATSLSLLESNNQEQGLLAYRDNPDYRGLLLSFQNGDWEECIKKIDRLLLDWPDDSHLLAFKQEVEIRIKLQKISQSELSKEKFKKLQRIGLRILIVIIIGVILYLFVRQAANVYQVNKLNQEIALTAQALQATYQRAENLMNAGREDEALPIYQEIQRTNPSYKDVNDKIALANQAIHISDLYAQGAKAFADGEKDKAFELLLTVDKLRPDYKETPQMIKEIEQEREIASLVKEIENSYSHEDWEGVIKNYEILQSLDAPLYTTDLKDVLFNSYRKLIITNASRSDLTLEDIETIEKYYREALSLFPQNKEYVTQRDELQKIAVELLASKYYLLGLNLLESSNYSLRGLQESIRVLRKADNIGTSSPAIAVEIEKAQLFLGSYDDVLHYRWDTAIANLEKLLRKDENYAGGRAKYFLYEAYIARGDTLFSDGDFAGAFSDYQNAEKFAWGDQNNLLRLFQVEVRIANILHKMGQDKDASDFYHNIFERLDYRKRLTGPQEQDLLNILIQADLTYKKGDLLEDILLYQSAMKQKDKLFDQKTISVKQGDTLANIAFENNTSIESLRAANRLGENMVINKKQDLVIPLMPSNGQ